MAARPTLCNIKLTIQYDGTDYCGFERQKNGPSIQAAVEKALQKIFKTPTRIIGASRTDAGVHACCQVVSFKTKSPIPVRRIPQALNGILPPAIRVMAASLVGPKYNPRFAAKSKTYEYLIYNGEVLNPLFNRFVWHIRPRLNIAAMKKAAKYLVGKHDFSSFCASHSNNKDPIRVLHQLVISHSSVVIWDSCQLSVVSCKLKGNGFLYKMVRNIVGTLVEVGMGKRKPQDVKAIIDAKDRKKAGRTAPAQGLCLVKVNE
ncbi:MAG: tRNA pseudouridine(38-40) synthase TruA [Candidatus Margulisbacteria bacterium]|nr:tRNA pseudouridine(38-40) synthase TruA [Candidatus Margulisiibacteriota bacterium]